MAKLLPGTITKTVTTAGTPEALSATVLHVSSFVVVHQAANAGSFKVGPSGDVSFPVKIDQSFSSGFIGNPLMSGDFFDLSEWFVDVSADGEGVEVFYVKR